MELHFFIKFLCFVVFLTFVQSKERFLTSPCYINEPDINVCIQRAVKDILPKVYAGSREHGIVPIDPLVVPSMKMEQKDYLVDFSIELLNSMQYGVGGLQVDKVRVNSDFSRIVANTTVPLFELKGRYDAHGRILFFPLEGNGPVNLKLKNLGLDLVFDFIEEKKKKRNVWKFKNFRVYFTFRNIYYDIGNLFNGNKILGDYTNRMLNTHSLEVINALKISVQDLYSILFQPIIQGMFNTVPFMRTKKKI